ncbi:unnamed protein product [Paramecium sonneborni]|uniref:Transmembrane protein n=1 Tax=Paramecium sonneborni TaxID=65129 RepID=A0A8S1PG71_9CILI|nr:unnamed protein product [Paramecium sonneborni]
MNLPILFLFLSQLIESMTFEIIDLKQQYQIYKEEIDFSNSQFEIDTLLMYGIWSKYNPLSPIAKVGPVGQLDSNCYLIHYAISIQNEKLNLIYYDCLYYINRTILKSVEFVDEDNNQKKFEIPINSKEYENFWHLCQIIIMPHKKKFELIIINQEKTLLHQILDMKLPFKDQNIQLIFGSSLIVNNTNINSKKTGQKFAMFPGFLKVNRIQILQSFDELNLETRMQEILQSIIECWCIQDNTYQLKDWDLQFFSQQTHISEYTNCDSFQFHGWLRINNIGYIAQETIYQVIKISSNYNSIILANENLSPFQFIYKLSSSMHSIIITTYSYTFPIVNIDFSENPFLLIDEFDVFNKVQLWHKLNVNLLKNQFQISITFYDGSDIFVKNIERDVQQFNQNKFKVSYGNLLNQNNNIVNIQARNFIFSNCQYPIDKLNCHQSCQECDGPTQFNCLSCSKNSKRIYQIDQKICICPSELVDTGEECKSYSDLGLQLIHDETINNQNICPFGYFVIDQECYQCPSIINSQRITCLNCILNPKTWFQKLFCNQDLSINKIGETASYYDYGEIFYFFDGSKINICPLGSCEIKSVNDLILETSNKVSFKLIQNENQNFISSYQYTEKCYNSIFEVFGLSCKECPVEFILSDGKCQDVSCDLPYYMSINGRCKKCSIKNCKYCFEYQRNDLTKCTLYHDFQAFNTDEIVDIGCALCNDDFIFDFSLGSCIQRKQIIQNCLRSFINLQNEDICTLSSNHDFSIAPEITNCQEFIENCLQCIQTPDYTLKCIVCDIGYASTLENGICMQINLPNQNFKIITQNQDIYYNGYIQLIQSFMMSFLPNQYLYPYNGNQYFDIQVLQCYDGWVIQPNSYFCIQDCSSDCLQCENNNQQSNCRVCSLDQFLQPVINQQLGQCYQCPRLCKICKLSVEEIENYNSTLILNENLLYQRQCIMAQQIMNVQLNIELQIAKYCFDETCNQIFLFETIIEECFFFNLFNVAKFNQFQIDYYNQMGQDQLILQYIFNFTNNCIGFRGLAFMNDLKQQIYSLKFVKLNAIAINSPYLHSLGALTIINFDSIHLQNFNLKLYQSYIDIQNNNKTVELSLTNIIIEDNQFTDLKTLFYGILFLKINFQNVSFINTNILNSSILNFEIMKLNGSIHIYQLQFINCIIRNSNVFQFLDDNFQIQIDNLIIQECEFYNSTIFQFDSNQNVKSKFIFNNLIVKHSKLYNSTFYYNSFSFNLVMSNLIIEQNTLDQSIIFSSNQEIHFSSALIQNNTFLNSCLLQSYPFQDTQFNIKDLIIQNNILQNSTIIKIKSNQQLIKISLILIDFDLNKNYQYSSFNQESALFEITCFNLIIKNFKIKNINNFRIFYIQDTNQIEVDNLIYKNNNIQKRIPIFIECQEQIYENSQLLLIIDSHQIRMKNLLIQSQSTIDLPLVQIISKYHIINSQNSIIYISNMEFFGNVQLQQKESSFQSLLIISSEQQIEIVLDNLLFFENMFHSQTQDTQYAACLLYIFSKIGNVEIKKLTSKNNAITNSSNTFILINSNSLIISNMFVENHNFLNVLIWQKYYQLNITFNYNQDEINQIIMQTIQIQNSGGVAKFETNNFSCINSTFQKIIALRSLIFDITLQGSGFFALYEIEIINVQNNLNQSSESSGCITIKSQNSQINIDIQKIKFQNVYSRSSSAIFTITPSIFSSKITIKNIVIENCFSLMNSVMNLKFYSQEKNKNQVRLEGLKIIQQKSNLMNYLSTIIPLTIEEIAEMNSDENSLIIISECFVEIKDIVVLGVYLYPIIKFKNVPYLVLQNCFFQEIQTVFTLNIISFTQSRNQKSIFILKQVTIQKISDFKLDIENFNQHIIIQYFIRDCESIQKQEIQDSYKQLITLFLQQIEYYSSNSVTSLIYFKSTSNQNKFILQSIKIALNECLKCEKGLLQFDLQNFNQIIIKDIICQENNIKNYGCLNFQQEQLNQNKILIQNSNFINNKGGQGVAIFTKNTTIKIQQCKIILNQALKQGGGLFFEQSSFTIKQTTILKNFAREGGGIFLSGNSNLNDRNFIQSFLLLNQAEKLSNNVFETPSHLSLKINSYELQSNILHDSQDQQRILKLQPFYTIEQGKKCLKQYLMIPSNQKISEFKLVLPKVREVFSYIKEFNLQFKNSRNEFLLGLINSTCIISSQVTSLISNKVLYSFENTTISYSIENNYFDLNQVNFIFDPYQSNENYLKIQFTCLTQESNTQLKYLVYAKSFMCQLGEFYANQSCQECQSSQGYYSVTYNATKCSIFDKTKFSKITSNSISLLEGYWRPDILSDQSEKCYKNLKVCIGGFSVGNELCAQGHVGGLCEECDYYDLSGNGLFYKNFQNFECFPCNQLVDSIFPLIITTFCAILSIILTLRSIDKSNNLFSALNLTKKHSKIIFKLNQDLTSILIKMFLNYLWVFSMIFTFNLKFSFSFNIVDQVSNTSYSIANDLDCSLTTIQQVQLVYSRIIAMIILILMQLFLVLIGYKIFSIIIHQKFNYSIITNTSLYLYVYNFGGLIKMLCSVISIRKISNIEYISGDVTLLFGSENHQKWMYYFIIPLLLIFGFTIPFSLFILLYTQKNKLQTTKFRKHICYLFNEYDNDTYYWELIKLILKFFIILITIYFEEKIFMKASLIGLCLLIYQILAIKYKPYIFGNLNQLDLLAGQICSIALFIAIIKYVGDSEDQTFSSYIPQIIITLLLIRLSYLFVIKIIYSYKKKYKTVLIKILYVICKFINENSILTEYFNRKLQNEKQKEIKLITNMKKIRQCLIMKQRAQQMWTSSFQSPQQSLFRSDFIKA